MARPKKTVNKEIFEGLCAIQCTKEEICCALNVSDKTLDKWCARTYQDDDGNGLSFSEVFALKRGMGKISLRRHQFELSKKSAAMAIHLGRVYLDQRYPDEIKEAPERQDAPDDGFLDALKGEAATAWEKD